MTDQGKIRMVALMSLPNIGVAKDKEFMATPQQRRDFERAGSAALASGADKKSRPTATAKSARSDGSA